MQSANGQSNTCAPRRLLGTLLVMAAVAALSACGKHSSSSTSIPAKVSLSPSTPVSLTLGTSQIFTPSALNSTGQSLRATFSFESSDTSILNFSPSGLACGGTWNAPLYNVCSPAGTGVVQVTATADGVTSTPTLVFVHAPVDNIQLSIVPPTDPPVPCAGQQNIPPACAPTVTQPVAGCYTANQPQTLQATAYSQGHDVTASVGPFSWSAQGTGVVALTPIISSSTHVATNLATAAPGTPGLTQVIATAAGSSSQPFNFETCPVQCVAVEVATGTQQSGMTTFITNKGTGETLNAWAVDVQGCLVPKPALTWVSSQPVSISSGGSGGCAAGTTCAITTPEPGSASITAACTPPTCNAGFPLAPAGVVAPQPVYPVTPISGLVNGAAGTFTVIATSTSCADAGNPNCTTSLYSLASGKDNSGTQVAIPNPPNSLLFDSFGVRGYMGSPYGAMVVTPSSFGTSNSAFTLLPATGTTTGVLQGRVLAVSPKGNNAVFTQCLVLKDCEANTINTQYAYYVTDIGTPSTVALSIANATAAGFSTDGLKAYIAGFDQHGNRKLFVYSSQQGLQSFDIPANNPVKQILPSASGAFVFLNGGSATSMVSVRNTCNNQLATDVANVLPVINLPTQPLLLKVVPPGNFPMGSNTIPNLQKEGLDILMGVDNTGIDLIATNASQPAQNALCPQTITLAKLASNPAQTFAPVHIDLGQGTFTPINFFLSPDETQVYIVTTNFSGVFVYNLLTRTTSAIQLVGTGNPLPISADMTADGSFIYIAASDGLLHAVSTFPAADLYQISFPSAPDSTNAFCTNAVTTPNCTLNFVAIQP